MTQDLTLKELIEQEGDLFHFTHQNHDCLIRRVPHLGHLCGYVRIDNQPDYKKTLTMAKQSTFALEEYFNDAIPSHKGITYCDTIDDMDGFWIGFDCAHAGDLMPFNAYNYSKEDFDILYRHSEYRTRDYVQGVLIDMVEFLASHAD